MLGCVVGLVGCVGTVNAAGGELTVLSDITRRANAAEETVAVNFTRAAVLTVCLGADCRRQRGVFAVSSGGTRLTVTRVVQFARNAFTQVEARRAPTRVCVVALSAEVAGGAEAHVRLAVYRTLAAELARLAGARGRGLAECPRRRCVNRLRRQLRLRPRHPCPPSGRLTVVLRQRQTPSAATQPLALQEYTSSLLHYLHFLPLP